jgi:hypothetical protein
MLQGTAQLQLLPEDLQWAGISFERLSQEELAAQLLQNNERVRFCRGGWWKEARSCFWLPCFDLAEFDHRLTRPPLGGTLGGYMHVAAPGTPSNGYYPAIVRQSVKFYSISKLSKDRRYKVRKALKQLTVRVINTLDELLTNGYEVYVSCRERIQWGADKTDRETFQTWIRNSFGHDNRLALGVYFGDKLVGFRHPYVIDDVATSSYIVSHSDYLKYFPNDALNHAFLSIARQTPGVHRAFFGPVSSKRSLDEFKLEYATVEYYPSYTWINPALKPFVASRLSRRYPWLDCQGPVDREAESEP